MRRLDDHQEILTQKQHLDGSEARGLGVGEEQALANAGH